MIFKNVKIRTEKDITYVENLVSKGWEIAQMGFYSIDLVYRSR